MGVTINSKNYSIDMGGGGFGNLRKKVAELTGKEIGEHYEKLDKGMFLYEMERVEFFKKYNNWLVLYTSFDYVSRVLINKKKTNRGSSFRDFDF